MASRDFAATSYKWAQRGLSVFSGPFLWARGITFSALQKISLQSEHSCVFVPEAWAGAEHPKEIFNVSPILKGEESNMVALFFERKISAGEILYWKLHK